ncbi:sugar transferase [Streptomyces sp. NBC_00370]|uniref:sugar transferase n=1 Tax=Streptomyces sp. NBC_00370 TaxID=2975728 RepID=UPI002E275289
MARFRMDRYDKRTPTPKGFLPTPHRFPANPERFPASLERFPVTPERLLANRFLADPKRLLDLTLGSVLLAVSAPALAVAALAVAATRPPGGILASDYRTGRDGHPFIVRSLRTRRFRLDLLSRLPHVVRGQMSLVGPAPLVVGSPGAAPRWRQSVRPGLTGLAQVRRHSALPWDEAPLLDQHYVEHHWIGLDLLILARSVPALQLARPARAEARHAAELRCAQMSTQAALSDTDHRLRRYIAVR